MGLWRGARSGGTDTVMAPVVRSSPCRARHGHGARGEELGVDGIAAVQDAHFCPLRGIREHGGLFKRNPTVFSLSQTRTVAFSRFYFLSTERAPQLFDMNDHTVYYPLFFHHLHGRLGDGNPFLTLRVCSV